MPRILWFALGAVAGVAYASRTLTQERPQVSQDQVAKARTQGAQRVREMMTRAADTIDDFAHKFGPMLESRGHELADRLRGGERAEHVVVTGRYGEPLNEPLGMEANR